MKKMIFSIALLFITSTFGLVWENDPSFTPEQRENARKINEQINNRNREIEATRNKEIEEATERFTREIEAIKAKYPFLVG